MPATRTKRATRTAVSPKRAPAPKAVKPVGTRAKSLAKRPSPQPLTAAFQRYRASGDRNPMLLIGEARETLAKLPTASVDCAMTSPPYWGKREYAGGGIGLEPDYRDFIRNLAAVFLELKRVLKPTGSFWLNIGDSYLGKNLVGIPWRMAFELTDNQGWMLRNSVVWNKVKSGMDNTKDRLGSVHENVFHFVQQPTYFYDANAVRSKPREAKIVNGAVVSGTGVSGVRYKRQIELSTALSLEEKQLAMRGLKRILADIGGGAKMSLPRKALLQGPQERA